MPDETTPREAADRRARREIWTNRGISILALTIAAASWLSPREPTPAKIDPNFIYKDGSQIGHVESYSVTPFVPNFILTIDQATKITPNDIIEYLGKRCAIYLINETKIDLYKLTYSYYLGCKMI
jgi:hypothetical protein